MATGTLEECLNTVETKLEEVQLQLANSNNATQKKRGWRWFVGIYADSPDFNEVVRIGEGWRDADRPKEDAE